jgi:hypothetical protein
MCGTKAPGAHIGLVPEWAANRALASPRPARPAKPSLRDISRAAAARTRAQRTSGRRGPCTGSHLRPGRTRGTHASHHATRRRGCRARRRTRRTSTPDRTRQPFAYGSSTLSPPVTESSSCRSWCSGTCRPRRRSLLELGSPCERRSRRPCRQTPRCGLGPLVPQAPTPVQTRHAAARFSRRP